MKTLKQTLPFLLFVGILAMAMSCSSPKKEKEEKKLSPRETVDLFLKNLIKDNLPGAKALCTVGYGEELKLVVLSGAKLPSSLYEILDISMPDEKSAVAKVKIGDDLAEIHLVMLEDGTWLVNKSIGLYDTTIVNASGELRKYEMTEIEDNVDAHQLKKKVDTIKNKVKNVVSKKGGELMEEGEELIDEGEQLIDEKKGELKRNVQNEKQKLEEKLENKKEEGQELIDQKQDELQKDAKDEQNRLRKKLESKKSGLPKKKG